MNYQEKREKALVLWEEAVRLIPTDIQVQGALWGCGSECNEVAEEVAEYLRACRAYPSMPKNQVFFGEEG